MSTKLADLTTDELIKRADMRITQLLQLARINRKDRPKRTVDNAE